MFIWLSYVLCLLVPCTNTDYVCGKKKDISWVGSDEAIDIFLIINLLKNKI